MMETILLVIVILLGFFLLITMGVVAFLVSSIFSLSDRISKIEDNLIDAINTSNVPKLPRKLSMEDEVASGLVKGLQQLKEDDERQQKLFELARRQQMQPVPVMNQNSAAVETLDTGGDLIPANLTKEEIDVLREFYEKP